VYYLPLEIDATREALKVLLARLHVCRLTPQWNAGMELGGFSGSGSQESLSNPARQVVVGREKGALHQFCENVRKFEL
jgi:hypothetical protein